MTLRITDDFTITRSGQELVVEVFGAFPARVRLTRAEAFAAVSAFLAMYVMMDSNSCYEIEPEVLEEKQEAALPKAA